MISFEEVGQIHEMLIEKFGGKRGLRDNGGLLSALNRPYSTFDGNDLYPDPVHKAAAIIESIVVNHPFIDGNKRTGYVLMRLLLLKEGVDIFAGEDDKYNFVIAISKGEMNFEQIREWIENRSDKI